MKEPTPDDKGVVELTKEIVYGNLHHWIRGISGVGDGVRSVLCQRELTNEEWICAATMAVTLVAICGATDLEKGDIPWYDPNCSKVKNNNQGVD